MTCRWCKACWTHPLGPRVSWSLKVPSLQVLRGKIDNLRRERLVFDDIFKKLEKSLQLQKKEMGGIIHISNGAFDIREKVSTRASASHIIQLLDRRQWYSSCFVWHPVQCLGLLRRGACLQQVRQAAEQLPCMPQRH